MRLIYRAIPALALVFFALLSLQSAAQTARPDAYTRRWAKIDSLIGNKGLYQSALTEVNALYLKAKSEKQEAQQLKALRYRLELQEALQEFSDTLAIFELDRATKESRGAPKAILYALQADYFQNYYDSHRWNLYNQTKTIHYQKENIRSWGPSDFHEAISKAWQEALREKELLQATSLAAFEPVIIKGNARPIRPSLYDLLAWKALNYFTAGNEALPRSKDAFRFNDRKLFSPAKEFSQTVFKSADKADPYFQAIEIYQDLLRFHLSDASPEALLDADIQRLDFVKENTGSADRETSYRSALTEIARKYTGTDGADQASYALALSYRDAAPEDILKAAEICTRVLSTKKNSPHSANCYNLLQEIRQPSLQLDLERVNLPGQPFRSLVTWRNLDKLFLRIIPIGTETGKTIFEDGNYLNTEKWALLLNEKAIREWEQALPETSDRKVHSAEIKIEALPIGEYLLLCSNDGLFSQNASQLSAVRFHVSAISYANKGNDYFFLHRETGQPLAKAQVQCWYRKYDYASRRYQYYKGTRYTTNDNGYVHFGDDTPAYSLQLEIRHQEDTLFIKEEEYHYNYNPLERIAADNISFEQKNAVIYFFTDRSIYRPGQTLYFKGIAVTKDSLSRHSKAYTAQKSAVYLYNANGEKIDSSLLQTNRFGSYSGQFKLPEGGLTGIFRLEDPLLHGSSQFSVEAYKRPKFYVSYHPQKGSYRLNDSITVNGFAKAYAGNPIQEAGLTYRVTRNTRYLYPWRWGWRPPFPRSEATTIEHGQLKTAADGSFQISFPALPDEKVERNTDPVFDFEISVDVTDLNGETRSASTTIPVSYKALQIRVSAPSTTLPLDSFRNVLVETKNINGVFEPAKTELAISPLQSPGRLVRNRYWAAPDQFVISESDFLAAFPLDEYRRESDPLTWKTGAASWKKMQTTDSSGTVNINGARLVPGWYQLAATTVDRYGDTVRDIFTLLLFYPAAKQLPAPSYLFAAQDKSSLQPGGSASLYLGSSASKIFLIRQIEQASITEEQTAQLPFSAKYAVQTLGKELQQQTYTATEADRGGIVHTSFFVKDNRFYQVSQGLAIPWKNKELEITINSYRDKTLPGAEEKWSVGISGQKGEKLAAELLTSLYDASLDQFRPHQWMKPSIWPELNHRPAWNTRHSFSEIQSANTGPEPAFLAVEEKRYDALLSFLNSGWVKRHLSGRVEGVSIAAAPKESALEEVVTIGYGTQRKKDATDRRNEKAAADKSAEEASPAGAPVGNATRKDFRETAFFFPQLQADEKGNYNFSFTMPEALTTWKWQLLAHTPGLATGTLQKTILTQKELMVQPNMPRFLREGDRMELTTKLVNLTNKEMTGQVELLLLDAGSGQPVDGWFHNFFPNQYFTITPNSSELVKFPVEVPYQFDKALTWKFIARAGNYSDGEEAILPVMSNRQLVTESLPFYLNGPGSKEYTFSKLLQSGGSETLSHRSLTVEASANPAWYAVQALPYLADYPYECAEQSFNRLYGNLLAKTITDRLPKIRSVLEKWNLSDTGALLSNLQKNQELKQVLMEETPWVLEAKTEAAQKKQIAQLFDLVQLAANQKKIATQLAELQTSNGGFSWFKGGPDDRYITQYIITGFGHLKQLGAIPEDLPQLQSIVQKALPYLDARIQEDYDRLKDKSIKAGELNYYAAQYLYMRSFFPERGIPGRYLTAVSHYRKEAQQNWIKGTLMTKAMIALALFRTGDKITANSIIRSLEESAITQEEMGMYWKNNTTGYRWQDAPIETQSLLIEAFSEIKKEEKITGALKTWLLKQKQTNHWSSTKATADACYALLLSGADWLAAEPRLALTLGTVKMQPEKTEAGSGYFKKQVPGTAVFPEMGNIRVSLEIPDNSQKQAPVWGAVYWQYFENLDKISPSASPLKIRRQLMVEKQTNKGPVLEPVTENSLLKMGDKIKVRMELSTDRAMEYVHLKDMRASALEPVNVLSGYTWQGGLSYYESTRDASTNFFIDYLPGGTYVLEYALFVTHTGVFSNGISTVQCMYAPEFTSHSEGITIHIE